MLRYGSVEVQVTTGACQVETREVRFADDRRPEPEAERHDGRPTTPETPAIEETNE